jgi:hypothetical protein
MKPLSTMRAALDDERLLGGALPGPSWLPWRVLLIAAMGEELTDEEREVFASVTGREREPGTLVEEFYGITGRRSGKTRAAGTLSAYVAGLCDHADKLAPGERAALPILAASVSQAGRAFMHTRGILQNSPVLSQEIVGEPTAGVIRLKTGVDIEVRPASFRTIRGVTAVAAVADEVAFWRHDQTANPDKEILDALRPALATTGGPLWVISSPYAKRGEIYNAWRRDHGPTGDPQILIARGPSRVFNSSLPQRVVDRAYARDATAAMTEYGAEFRSDIEGYVTIEIVEACVSSGVRERPYERKFSGAYRAFVDPSGGVADAMTLAIAHREGGRAVLDVARERKSPFQPAAAVEEFATLLKAYGIAQVTGDRYGGEWPRDEFRKHGIAYRLADKTRSDLYRDVLPMLNSGEADLLDLPVLVNQFVGLERRVARGGRESIDHAPNGHDDVANAVAGVLDGLAIRHEAPTARSTTFSWG